MYVQYNFLYKKKQCFSLLNFMPILVSSQKHTDNFGDQLVNLLIDQSKAIDS